jgi:hypothetical protein
MKVISNDNIVAFDVDDTLVFWDIPADRLGDAIEFDSFGQKVLLLPHLKHVEMMRRFKARGHFVIVWSQGGYEWAEEVIKKLGAQDAVDLVMTKPKWIIDDLPPNLWMTRAYLDLNGKRNIPNRHLENGQTDAGYKLDILEEKDDKD